MTDFPNVNAERLDFALLPLGDRIVTAVPLRRMPQDAVAELLMAPPGGPQFLTAVDLLMTALTVADAERFSLLDFGEAFTTVQAFLQTQVKEGYPSLTLDLDDELKDLLSDD